MVQSKPYTLHATLYTLQSIYSIEYIDYILYTPVYSTHYTFTGDVNYIVFRPLLEKKTLRQDHHVMYHTHIISRISKILQRFITPKIYNSNFKGLYQNVANVARCITNETINLDFQISYINDVFVRLILVFKENLPDKDNHLIRVNPHYHPGQTYITSTLTIEQRLDKSFVLTCHY